MPPTGVIDAIAGRPAALAAALADRLPDARWFGDKGRPLVAVEIADVAAAPDGPSIGLAILRLRFAEGDDSLYLLPLAVADDAAAPAPLLPAGEGMPAVADALAAPRFPGWLLARLAAGDDLVGGRGRFAFAPLPGGKAILDHARREPGRVLAAEQSNSAIRYGDALIVKLFRRLREGVNPDLEVGAFLWEETAFRHLPEPVVAAAYRPERGGSLQIAFGQAFVPNVGDGWTWTLNQIAAMLALDDDPARRAAIERQVEAASTLGRRTAEMHRALASRRDNPAFAPEPIAPERIRAREADLRQRLGETLADLAATPNLPPAIAALLPGLLAAKPALEARATGFAAEAGDVAIRVHGDFHLGQVLRSGDDWTILDFEGEPARPLAERRAKTSALKDVAGMLRSFAYAHGAALQAHPGRTAALAAWEAASRAAFLAAYQTGIARAEAPIAPSDPAAFARACDAWELDKAVYEIAYERRNRPDWLAIPLAALLRSEPD